MRINFSIKGIYDINIIIIINSVKDAFKIIRPLFLFVCVSGKKNNNRNGAKKLYSFFGRLLSPAFDFGIRRDDNAADQYFLEQRTNLNLLFFIDC